VRLLLDSHVYLWAVTDSPELRASARAATAEPANLVYVSAATIWELALKAASGRLVADVDDLLAGVAEAGFAELPVIAADGADAARLPRLHDDPFDRMLVAQARRRGLTLVTADHRLAEYDADVLLL
jgi:PIN domain nuclease of toxin-antitoxin system